MQTQKRNYDLYIGGEKITHLENVDIQLLEKGIEKIDYGMPPEINFECSLTEESRDYLNSLFPEIIEFKRIGKYFVRMKWKINNIERGDYFEIIKERRKCKEIKLEIDSRGLF